ncbi:MAG TPA: PAS domain S-box protein [Streptosporangiaceae bacterium]
MDTELVAAAILAGPDAIIAADRAGTVTFWNAGAERLFGFTAAEAAGQSLDLIIPERLRDRHWHGWQSVLATGQSRYGPGDLLRVPGQRKDGTRLSLEFAIHPVHDHAGVLVGIAATLRDVTAQFEELRTLRRQAAPPQERGSGTSA